MRVAWSQALLAAAARLGSNAKSPSERARGAYAEAEGAACAAQSPWSSL